MLKAEALPPGPPILYRVGEVEDLVLLHHLELLIEAGLLLGKITRSQGSRGDVIGISGLTWEGHEWIEMVRSQSVWNETKSLLLGTGGALTYELTKAAASRILRARLDGGEGRADVSRETAIVKREGAGWDSNPRDP